MQTDKLEQKITRIGNDLANARTKSEEWKNRVTELEKQLETAENLRIVQIVRNTEITPDMLKQILSMQKSEPFISTSALPEIITDTPAKSKKERTSDYEKNTENE
jgi:predicted nuclease with TOPRIM domain